MPELAISIDVPKSGCSLINNVGSITIAKPKIKCSGRGGKCLRPIYQATIIGTASFINSEG